VTLLAGREFYLSPFGRTNPRETAILCAPMHDTEHNDQAPVSKTRRKREMEALQRLGEALLSFDAEALQQLGLPDQLLGALDTASRIKSHGARRRQLQYIGKLMRQVDTAPIEAAVHARQHQQSTNTRGFHQLEELREALITGGDATLATVQQQFPQADRQRLRKLARQARKEREDQQPPKAARTLFRYLRELQEASGNSA
jgi:ribosome-associated protein